VPAVLYVL